MTRSDLFVAVETEVERARGLYPSPDLLVTAMAEEAGEVVQASLNHRQGKGASEKILKEIVQTMAMCVRLAEEGDPLHAVPPLVVDSRAANHELSPAPEDGGAAKRCSVCGSQRLRREDGTWDACSLVPGDRSDGCPDPLHDYYEEHPERRPASPTATGLCACGCAEAWHLSGEDVTPSGCRRCTSCLAFRPASPETDGKELT